MKEESKNAFFAAVVNKKLIYSGWTDERKANHYFVPTSITSYDCIGKEWISGIYHSYDIKYERIFELRSGFELDKYGHCWEFYKESAKPSIRPFDISDAEFLLGNTICKKNTKLFLTILSVDEEGVDTINDYFTYEELLKTCNIVDLMPNSYNHVYTICCKPIL